MHKNVLCVIDIANPKLSGLLLQRASAVSTLDRAALCLDCCAGSDWRSGGVIPEPGPVEGTVRASHQDDP